MAWIRKQPRAPTAGVDADTYMPCVVEDVMAVHAADLAAIELTAGQRLSELDDNDLSGIVLVKARRCAGRRTGRPAFRDRSSYLEALRRRAAS